MEVNTDTGIRTGKSVEPVIMNYQYQYWSKIHTSIGIYTGISTHLFSISVSSNHGYHYRFKSIIDTNISQLLISELVRVNYKYQYWNQNQYWNKIHTSIRIGQY